ncbi:hypothetical protein CIW54_13940 [Paraburkholderia sp. T12-10]|nr:hypothetical protein CIW54_13940 [Paraburkholderia sp. T12-10]
MVAFATVEPVLVPVLVLELDPPPPQAERAAAIVAQRVNFRNPGLRLLFNFYSSLKVIRCNGFVIYCMNRRRRFVMLCAGRMYSIAMNCFIRSCEIAA